MVHNRDSSWSLGNRLLGVVDMDVTLKKISPVLEKDIPYFQPEPPSQPPQRSEMSRPMYHKAMLAEFWKYIDQFRLLYMERCREIEKFPRHSDRAVALNSLIEELDRLERWYKPYIQYASCHEKRGPSPLTVTDCTPRILISKAVREETIKKYKHRCAYCGKKGDKTKGPDGASWHIDHIIPHSWGGPHDSSNFALSCRRCNLSKHNMWWHPAWRPKHA